MEPLASILIAAVTGLVSGFLLSVPIGPVNLTIVNEGARRGFLWGALIGLGATLMDTAYCALAFTGFSSLLRGLVIGIVIELISFLFLLYLGGRFLFARRLMRNSRLEQRLEDRWHPHSAFMTGFVRVLGNPGVLLVWLILAANFVSRGWVQPTLTGKLSCVGGVAMGTALWFVGLSWAVSLGHARCSEKTLVRIEHGSGLFLLALAAVHGVHLVIRLVQHSGAGG